MTFPPGASPAAVRAAYVTAAKSAHPDAPGGSAEAFARLHAAYREALQAALEWPCDACDGAGRVEVHGSGPGGFGASVTNLVCGRCGGRGKKWPAP